MCCGYFWLRAATSGSWSVIWASVTRPHGPGWTIWCALSAWPRRPLKPLKLEPVLLQRIQSPIRRARGQLLGLRGRLGSQIHGLPPCGPLPRASWASTRHARCSAPKPTARPWSSRESGPDRGPLPRGRQPASARWWLWCRPVAGSGPGPAGPGRLAPGPADPGRLDPGPADPGRVDPARNRLARARFGSDSPMMNRDHFRPRTRPRNQHQESPDRRGSHRRLVCGGGP